MNSNKISLKIVTEKRTLVDISNYSISADKISFLFGESGIGKSIINKAIFGLIDPDLLRVTINGKNYHQYINSPFTTQISENGFFVFQEPSSHLNPLITIGEQLREGSLQKINPGDELKILKHLWSTSNEDILKNLLKVFPKPYRPSGGEKQRFLLAMAFKKLKQHIDNNKNGANLFVFDEPSGSLDNAYRNDFIKLLCAFYKAKPFTAIVITHDYSIISTIENQLSSFSAVIDYKELYKENDKIVLRDFEKKEYLSWISSQEGITSISNNKGEILRLKSGIKNFGVKLSFHQEKYDSPEVDLLIDRGDLIYLKARSGVGKTTVSKIILGLLRPDALDMILCGHSINEKCKTSFWKKNIWGRKATMVFQHADEALNLNVTVFEVFKVLLKKGKVTKKRVRKIVQQLFEGEITDAFLMKKIKFLSGGQKQRINILRSLVLNTDLLIMDEPLNGLDLKSNRLVIEEIKRRQKEGKSILMISHNEEIFDKIVPVKNIYYLKTFPVGGTQ